jgi:hypothetical protein
MAIVHNTGTVFSAWSNLCNNEEQCQELISMKNDWEVFMCEESLLEWYTEIHYTVNILEKVVVV